MKFQKNIKNNFGYGMLCDIHPMIPISFHMVLKKSASVFNGEENQDEILQKTLRVINKPYKDTYVPGINIKGKYLSVYGFNLGDKVEVLVSENQISISKIIDETKGLET